MRQNLDKPIEEARSRYEARGYNFDELLLSMSDDGFVVSVPYLFAMGYFYDDCGKRVCFIRACVGSMAELLRLNLFKLDFIEFQRNFSGQTRRYSFERFTKKIK